MSGIKWGLISAGIALVVSVALGILGGVSAFHIFIRALVFTVVFFGLGFGLYLMINNFFPELLFSDDENTKNELFERPGARVNITLDTTGEYAVPELYNVPGDSNVLGNIEDLISGVFKPRSEHQEKNPVQEGIDRIREEGYNNGKAPVRAGNGLTDASVFEKPKEEKPVFTPVFDVDSDGLGNLPDLDAMAFAFSGRDEPSPSGLSGSLPLASPFEADGDFFDESVPPDFGIASPFGISPEPAGEPIRSSRAGNKPQPLQGDFDPKELAEGIRTVLSKDK